MPTAKFPPSTFVDELTDPGFFVAPIARNASLRSYLCANPNDGGNDRAAVLQGALREVTKGTDAGGRIRAMGLDYDRVFTGQGKPEYIDDVMWMAAFFAESLKAYKNQRGQTPLAKYYTGQNPIQAMVDDKVFGMDCIGFVGRYLEASGILTAYPPYYPRHYCDKFYPVTDFDEIDDLCVLVWVNGHHVAMIDSVLERVKPAAGSPNAAPPYVIANICQSSDGKSEGNVGPQFNTRVKLQKTTGDFLDFGPYGQVVDRNSKLTEDEKSELRKQYTHTGSDRGYRRGLFFNVLLGQPAPPVGGRVYICKLPGGVTKGWQSIELD